MAKKLIVALAAVLAVAFAAWAGLRAMQSRPEWTTSSSTAAAELRRGIAADRKVYKLEAQRHFERALQLDPQCTAAAMMLLGTDLPLERRKALLARLAASDRSRLTPRETFLVEYTLASDHGRDPARPKALVDAYLASHPRDPYALYLAGSQAWKDRRWNDAERYYQELLAVDPNWVDAQNRLGYNSMAQGRFAEAEDRFRTYRYVAPDQANPHDSLGELFVILGRFDDAQHELEEAVRIRPDFCSSYANLMTIARWSGHPERIESYVARGEHAGCGADWAAISRCGARSWHLYVTGDWAALAHMFSEPCVQQHRAPLVLIDLGVVLSGDLGLARRIESFEHQEASIYMAASDPLPTHLRAVREVAEGKLPAALEDFAATDRLLEYRRLDDAALKMYNRLQWAHALEAAGDHDAAQRLVDQVNAVNRWMGARYAILPAPRPPGPAVSPLRAPA